MDRKKKILLTGPERWVNVLTELIGRHGNDLATVTAVPASLPSVLMLPYFALSSDIVVRVGFRPGMNRLKAKIFDGVWALLAKLRPQTAWIFYWIGSDVIYESRDAAAGKLTGYFHASRIYGHLAGAPWFVDELARIGFSATESLFPLELPQILPPPRTPGRRRVLTYIPDDRPEFYGSENIVRLAEEFPQTQFDIIGGKGTWQESTTSNMTFHGWVDGISSFLEKNPILLRLVEHDALGGTVREALAGACHVVYSVQVPHVRYVPFDQYQILRKEFGELVAADRNGTLPPNFAGKEYATTNWDARVLTRDLVTALLGIRKVKLKK